MKPTPLFCSLVALLFLLSVPVSSLASGTYAPRLPGKKKESPDQQAYNLGKQIYTGKASLGPVNPALTEGQEKELQTWAQQLPKRSKGRETLPALAGKLSPEQMKALGHYLQRRYKIKPAEDTL